PFGESVAIVSEVLQVFANAVLPDVHALVLILDGCIGREQISEVVVLGFVEVETVGALQAFDVVRVLDAIGAAFELCDLRGARRSRGDGGGRRLRFPAGGQRERYGGEGRRGQGGHPV